MASNVLEMVNNSIRAHRENEIEEAFMITFEFNSPELSIAIEDKGPGFDPGQLPYSLAEDPSDLDLKSERFNEYRKKHNFKRFGMGLHLVRKTFSRFNLCFLDSEGQPTAWEDGKICGTRIEVGVGGRVNDRA